MKSRPLRLLLIWPRGAVLYYIPTSYIDKPTLHDEVSDVNVNQARPQFSCEPVRFDKWGVRTPPFYCSWEPMSGSTPI